MERTEWLQLLTTDLGRFNDYRRENPREPVDLSGANLQGANLAQANLANVTLLGANLRQANLVGASLAGTDLREADLREADCTDALMHRTNLRGADLRQAKMAGFLGDARICLNACCFENVRYDRAQLEQILEVINMNSGWTVRYEIVPKEG